MHIVLEDMQIQIAAYYLQLVETKLVIMRWTTASGAEAGY